jgi:hypothetical protein
VIEAGRLRSAVRLPLTTRLYPVAPGTAVHWMVTAAPLALTANVGACAAASVAPNNTMAAVNRPRLFITFMRTVLLSHRAASS